MTCLILTLLFLKHLCARWSLRVCLFFLMAFFFLHILYTAILGYVLSDFSKLKLKTPGCLLLLFQKCYLPHTIQDRFNETWNCWKHLLISSCYLQLEVVVTPLSHSTQWKLKLTETISRRKVENWTKKLKIYIRFSYIKFLHIVTNLFLF